MRKKLIIFLPIAIFLLLALPRLNDVMGQDEASHYYKLTRMMFENQWTCGKLIVFSPHGYPILAAMLCKLFHSASAIAVRLCGMLLWTAVIAIVAKLDRHGMAALLLACFPAACQSAAIVEIDQAFLPFAALLMCLAFRHLLNHGKYGFLLASAAFAFALWGRLTTPVLLCAPLLIVAILKSRKDALIASAAMLTGAVAFLATWGLYCTLLNVDFSGPFLYLAESFRDTSVGSRAGGLSKYAQNVIYLCLWGFNPFLMLIVLLDGIRRFKRFWQSKALSGGDDFFLCAAAILVGYTFIGGSLFGFPKYQIPALPLLALALAESFVNLKWDKVATGLTITSFIIFLACGDCLFFLRMTLREHMALDTPLHYVIPIALLIAFAAGIIAALLEKKTALAWKLLALSLGCNLAWAARQSTANYSTGYIYGDTGECARLASVIRDNDWNNRRQMVHVEIAQQLGQYEEMGFKPNDAPTPEALAQLVYIELPDVVALSYAVMPVAQFREFMSSPELKAALEKYIPHRDGHLFYWTLAL